MPNDLGLRHLLSKDGFFAHLLGRTPSGRKRHLTFGRDLPVVLLTGGPGMGKERLLGEVHKRFAAKVPVINLDCSSDVYAREASAVPDARSTTTEALLKIAGHFSTWKGAGGSFAFPRLFAGLAVIATGADGGDPQSVATELDRLKHLLVKNRRNAQQDDEGRNRSGRGGWSRYWRGVGDILTLINGLVGQFPANLLGDLARMIVDQLATRHGRGQLQRLYGSYPNAHGQPEHGLQNLAEDFKEDGAGRALTESFLFRALREDLESAYASRSGWLRRVGRPGLLLNRSESPLGEHLLRAVLADRRSGQRDRVVIVGTAQRPDGGLFLQEGPPPGDDPVVPRAFRAVGLRRPAWTRRSAYELTDGPHQAPLADGVVLLRMPFLTKEQLQKETARTRTRVEPEGTRNRRLINEAVAQLSGGRPQTVLRLAAATASFRMPEDANDRVVLDAPLHLRQAAGEAAVQRAAVDVLLEDLVLDRLPVALTPVYRGRWLDLLTHLSVAHDDECARVLLQHHQAGLPNQLLVNQVSRLLADTGWPSCERHFIGDFGLRQLLLHRLYGLRPGGAAWREDHELLRDHYELRAMVEANRESGEVPPSGAPFRSATTHSMHHRLASGDVDEVARHLAGTLPRFPQEWCDELLDIAQAPFPDSPDTRRERAAGRVDFSADTPRLLRTVNRLLHAVWVCEERTRSTGAEIADTLSTLLNRLAEIDSPEAEQFAVTAAAWSERAKREQPLRSCSCTRRLTQRG